MVNLPLENFTNAWESVICELPTGCDRGDRSDAAVVGCGERARSDREAATILLQLRSML